MSYLRSTMGSTTGAAEVAPGAQKPTADWTLTRVDARVATFAVLSPHFADSLLADSAEMSTFLGSELSALVRIELDKNVEGVMDAAAVVPVSYATSPLNTIRRGATVVPDSEFVELETARLGIRHVRSTPHHPQTCGKVERFHQTEKKWLAKRDAAVGITQLQTDLDRFRAYYNTVRPHRAIGRRTPAEAFAARPKATPAMAGFTVPAHFRVRRDKVDITGVITLRHDSRLHHIGTQRLGQATMNGLLRWVSSWTATTTIDRTRRWEASLRSPAARVSAT